MKNNTFLDNRNARRGGFYWVDKKPYVSVTNVLSVISKPGLQFWYGKMVYQAVIKDPSLGQQEALAVPGIESGKAKARGTDVHKVVELYEMHRKGDVVVPEHMEGYYKALCKWFDDTEVKIEWHEKTLISHKYQYAGTADLLVKKGKENWLIDIKTGKEIYPEAFLQLSAYKQALEEEGTKVDRIGVLLLRDTGNYKFEIGVYSLRSFLAAKFLWGFLNKELCSDMGYTHWVDPIDK